MLLKLTNASVHYHKVAALRGIDLAVPAGGIVTIIGANGAGKTTTMRAISGLRPLAAGRILFDGEDISRLRADLRVVRGLCQSPEGRQIFPGMTVLENLDMGAYTRRDKAGIAADLDRVYGLFPRLQERHKQVAGTLSGGEQQMLAIGRALMAKPKLLLLDEPSMGLSPLLVSEIFDTIRALKAAGTTIFLVEQNAHAALAIADRGYVLETGRIVLQDSGPALLANDRVKEAYLGL